MVDVSCLQKELTECNRDREVSDVSVALHDGCSNISHLTGTIVGTVGTPYGGSTFLVDIRLLGGYPFEPPKMQFITKVWLWTFLRQCYQNPSIQEHQQCRHQKGHCLLHLRKSKPQVDITLKHDVLAQLADH